MVDEKTEDSELNAKNFPDLSCS